MYMREYPNLHLDITTSLGCLPQVSIDLEFEHRSSQTKDYQIGICCMFCKQSLFGSESG
jgi:hypothetical protein